MADQRTEVTIGAKIDEVVGAITQLQGQFAAFAKNTTEKLNSVNVATDALTTKVKQLVVAFVSFKQLEKSVEITKDLAIEAANLARQFGITAGEASVFAVAIGDAYGTVEQVARANDFLNRQLKQNEERLNALGLVTRDVTTGALRPQMELFKDAIGVLREYKEGTDRNTAGAEIFGLKGRALQEIMERLGPAMEHAKKKADELGLTLSSTGAQTVEEYRAALNDFQDALTAIRKVIGEALMPVLTSLMNWFSGFGKEAVEGFALSIKTLAIVLNILVGALKVVAEIAAATIQIIATAFIGMGTAIARALTFDFKGAARALDDGDELIKERFVRMKERIAEAGAEVGRNIYDIINPDTAAAGKPGAGGGSKGYKGEDKNRMGGFEANLAAKRAAYEAEGALDGKFQAFSLQMEQDFWGKILEDTKLKTEERQKISMKYWELEVKIGREAFETQLLDLKNQQAQFKNNLEERLKIAQQIAEKVSQAFGGGSPQATAAQRDVINLQREIASQKREIDRVAEEGAVEGQLRQLDMTRTRLEQAFALEKISKEQLIKLDVDLENQRYQIQRDALARQLALESQNPDRDPRKLAEIQRQLVTLEQIHQAKILDLRKQAAIESDRIIRRMHSVIQSSFATMFDEIFQGVHNLRDVFNNFFMSILSGMRRIIAERFAEKLFGPGTAGGKLIDMVLNPFLKIVDTMVTKWIFGEEVMTAATIVGSTERTAAETVAAATSLSVESESVIAKILNKGYETFASVYAAVSEIPYVGWILAPIMAGAALATVVAMVGSVVSAEVGQWNVPSEQLTLLHPGEAVLPAGFANEMRTAVGSGKGFGGGGGTSVTIYAMDGRDVERVLRRNGGALVKALSSQIRDFNVPRRT